MLSNCRMIIASLGLSATGAVATQAVATCPDGSNGAGRGNGAIYQCGNNQCAKTDTSYSVECVISSDSGSTQYVATIRNESNKFDIVYATRCGEQGAWINDQVLAKNTKITWTCNAGGMVEVAFVGNSLCGDDSTIYKNQGSANPAMLKFSDTSCGIDLYFDDGDNGSAKPNPPSTSRFPSCTNGSNTGNGWGWDPSVTDPSGSHSCISTPGSSVPHPNKYGCMVRNLRGAQYFGHGQGYGQGGIDAACNAALGMCAGDSLIPSSCHIVNSWQE